MVDIILDFLVNSGAKPFIDFGKKPDCAVVAEDETVYYEEEYIDFHNMLEWQSMFNAFTFHIIRRYGKEEIEMQDRIDSAYRMTMQLLMNFFNIILSL